MTNPVLWGPAIWQAMLASAWHCAPHNVPMLTDMLLRLVPLLLPCAKCRAHFAKHRPIVARRARGEPKTAGHAFRWIWFLKDQVNRTLSQRSISLDDLTERFALQGAVIEDVLLGDALVFMALEARALDRDALFLEFCAALHVLLPLPHDSQLRAVLACARRPIVPCALAAARAARVERGVPELGLARYKAVDTDA